LNLEQAAASPSLELVHHGVPLRQDVQYFGNQQLGPTVSLSLRTRPTAQPFVLVPARSLLVLLAAHRVPHLRRGLTAV
jgi:hypothetical protein